ncbi:MAG: hypothetical protein QM642_04755 [Edaphocola sp.]
MKIYYKRLAIIFMFFGLPASAQTRLDVMPEVGSHLNFNDADFSTTNGKQALSSPNTGGLSLGINFRVSSSRKWLFLTPFLGWRYDWQRVNIDLQQSTFPVIKKQQFGLHLGAVVGASIPLKSTHTAIDAGIGFSINCIMGRQTIPLQLGYGSYQDQYGNTLNYPAYVYNMHWGPKQGDAGIVPNFVAQLAWVKKDFMGGKHPLRLGFDFRVLPESSSGFKINSGGATIFNTDRTIAAESQFLDVHMNLGFALSMGL